MSTVAIILAAGLGKRMKSNLPKVLHPVLGDPSLLWVLRSLPAQVESAVLVLHHGKDLVEKALESWRTLGLLPCPVVTVDQEEPLGTGHAVQRAVEAVDHLGGDRVVILCGDVPLLRRETLESMLASPAVLLAMEPEDPTGYGRVIQHPDGSLKAVVEHKDASPEERAVRLANGGAYALPWPELRQALSHLRNDNAQGEYYLTDAVMEVAQIRPVAVTTCGAEELLGMNGRRDQAQLQAFAQDLINGRWMDEGVTFLHSETTLVGPRVRLAKDVVLGAGVQLEGEVLVSERAQIGQGCVLKDCTVGEGAELRPYCIAQQATIGPKAKIGPFAHLREGTTLEADVHVGNFVETKKTLLKRGSKANHLTYLGDCEVGERTNVGAGCITCNYDGVNKHRTVIGQDVFVGSDCQLVAPVTLGDGAIIGAGTTVTENVPSQALALSRPPMVIKDEGAIRLRKKLGPKRR